MENKETTLDQLFTLAGKINFDIEGFKFKLHQVQQEIIKRLEESQKQPEETPPEAA